MIFQYMFAKLQEKKMEDVGTLTIESVQKKYSNKACHTTRLYYKIINKLHITICRRVEKKTKKCYQSYRQKNEHVYNV